MDYSQNWVLLSLGKGESVLNSMINLAKALLVLMLKMITSLLQDNSAARGDSWSLSQGTDSLENWTLN